MNFTLFSSKRFIKNGLPYNLLKVPAEITKGFTFKFYILYFTFYINNVPVGKGKTLVTQKF